MFFLHEIASFKKKQQKTRLIQSVKSYIRHKEYIIQIMFTLLILNKICRFEKISGHLLNRNILILFIFDIREPKCLLQFDSISYMWKIFKKKTWSWHYFSHSSIRFHPKFYLSIDVSIHALVKILETFVY